MPQGDKTEEEEAPKKGKHVVFSKYFLGSLCCISKIICPLISEYFRTVISIMEYKFLGSCCDCNSPF